MKDKNKVLVLGTKNRGKIKELKALLKDLTLTIRTLEDFPDTISVLEDENSYEENAKKKAFIISERLGLPVLSEDSGLEVSILKGAPGILSARFCGPTATAKENNTKLLKRLKNIPWHKRKARFICKMALADVKGPLKNKVYLTSGECQGFISLSPRGKNGFGYDPLFYLPQLNKTFAELTLAQKNLFSHRAQALNKMKEFIKKYFF
jgi:XTP/dITP diphosphohydrolase